MNSHHARIAIVGGGLSGLYAAYLLEQRGITDYIVLEARENLGGRIVSQVYPQRDPSTEGNGSSFDLGPSWFWAEYQPQLDQLVRDLQLDCHEQYEIGQMLVEHRVDNPVMAIAGYTSSPPSMRLFGGMGALINALHSRLDPARIVMGHTVKRLRSENEKIHIASDDSKGKITTWITEHVLLAMPPRLVASRIDFFPELPKDLCASWSATDTWMAPHAKYFAIYEKPFWRDLGLSGQGRSRVGPMAEIHDASVQDGLAALFGFIAVPALVRSNMSDAQLKALCRTQLARMYGEQADSPVHELLQDWALEPFTATQADLTSAGRHVKPPKATVDSGLWAGRITGIASEWSPQFAGYLAGAVDAAANGVEALKLSASAERGASAVCDTMQSNQPEQLSVTPE